jgi:hypothetical protein
MIDRIKKRLEELRGERDRRARELTEQANLILAPYQAAIAELEALLTEEEAEQEGEK